MLVRLAGARKPSAIVKGNAAKLRETTPERGMIGQREKVGLWLEVARDHECMVRDDGEFVQEEHVRGRDVLNEEAFIVRQERVTPFSRIRCEPFFGRNRFVGFGRQPD